MLTSIICRDLLTRHETTHDRNNSAKGRTFIRRSDRAAEACQNCASSKAKCDDQKPCSRCRAKNIRCYIPSRRVHQYRTSHGKLFFLMTKKQPDVTDSAN